MHVQGQQFATSGLELYKLSSGIWRGTHCCRSVGEKVKIPPQGSVRVGQCWGSRDFQPALRMEDLVWLRSCRMFT